MRSGLGRSARLYVLLNLAPLLSVELEGHQEAEVLILGPAPHALLELHAASLQLLALVGVALQLSAADDRAANFVFVEGEVLGEVGRSTRNVPEFASRHLSRVLLEGQAGQFAHSVAIERPLALVRALVVVEVFLVRFFLNLEMEQAGIRNKCVLPKLFKGNSHYSKIGADSSTYVSGR